MNEIFLLGQDGEVIFSDKYIRTIKELHDGQICNIKYVNKEHETITINYSPLNITLIKKEQD